MLRSVSPLLGVLSFLLFVAGCHTPLALKRVQAKNPLAKNVAKTPTEIVDAWSSYAQTTSDGTTVRGMGGRIHFYDTQTKQQAIKVDGDLTIFVFDGNETDPAHAKPLKIFQFKADMLADHYSYQKPLGHGYHFFLPIDDIGGEELSLCIMVRFDNNLDNMHVMKQQPTYTVLAGRRPQPPTEPSIKDFLESRSLLAEASRNMTAHYDSAIQQAGYFTDTKEPESVKSNVLTIPLNDGMTRRLLEGKDISP